LFLKPQSFLLELSCGRMSMAFIRDLLFHKDSNARVI
jgi:hypothetical protein